MQFTVSILDSDTMIVRKVIVEAADAYEAHKSAMMKEIVDFDLEDITKIIDEDGTAVYQKNQGFYEPN
jgi:hypothetical protein